MTLGNLGNVQLELGELPVARATLERALAIFKTIYGPDHPRVAMTLGNLGIVHQKLGELPVARATFERVLSHLRGDLRARPPRGRQNPHLLGHRPAAAR